MPDPVIRLDPGAGHSCLHPFIPISSALGRRDVFAFGSSVSICPYYYGSSMCSPVIYLDVLLPSGEQGLLISSLLRLFEHQGGHGDSAVLSSTYIVLATSKKSVRSPCTFVLRNTCYDGGMNGGAGRREKRSKENGVSVRGWGESLWPHNQPAMSISAPRSHGPRCSLGPGLEVRQATIAPSDVPCETWECDASRQKGPDWRV